MKRSQWKNRYNKILHNCPYLITLLVTWFVMTAGGIGLCLYRNYNVMEQTDGLMEPVFVVWMDRKNQEEAALADLYQTQNPVHDMDEDGTKIGAGSDWTDASQNKETEDIPAELAGGELTDNAEDETAGGNADNKDILEKIKERRDKNKGGKAADPDGKEESHMGETLYVEYEPVETDSIYYFDVGKTALTTTYAYSKVGETYFDDAVFIGDSRTLGISDYAGFDADFFCENGMSVFKLLDDKGVVNQGTGRKESITQLLQQKQYGKIYIMLGMNDLGYGTTDFFQEEYRTVVEQIREWQPAAVIYILANLHVNREMNNMETEFNNVNINAKNAAAASLANGEDIFYLDANPLFTDKEGFLQDELTFDGVHLYADGYMAWRDFLMEHGVIK